MNNTPKPEDKAKLLDEKMQRHSLLYWMDKNNIVNEKEKRMDMHLFYFMKDLYKERSKRIAVRKSSQVGATTWVVLRSLHRCIYQGINQIHTQPTAGDASKFVESKVNEMIRLNYGISKLMDKESADSLRMKSIGKGFIFYQATIGRTQSFMISSDCNIYDELDRSNPDTIKNYRSRLEGADSLGEEIYISTPEQPEAGIDRQWGLSDQKHLRFNCPHKGCGKRQYMSFPESIDFDKRIYACKGCGKEIDNTQFPDKQEQWDIRWEPKYPERNISGYWINQMMLPWKTAGELIDDYHEKEAEGDLAYFYNHQIGVPYQDGESSVDEGTILQNIINKPAIKEKPSYMGVDVQKNELYAIIGNEEGIHGIMEIKGDTNTNKPWDRLAQVMDVYEIKVAVVDAGYRPNKVREFCARFPYRAYSCWYKEDPKKLKIARWGDESFEAKGTQEEKTKVLVDRERAIDRVVSKFHTGKIPLVNYTPNEESLVMFQKHWKVMYKRTVTTRDGEPKEEWDKTGQNDLAMATVYWDIAMEKYTTK